jgi:hypothetical protein
MTSSRGVPELDRQTVEHAVEAATWAPSIMNSQPWRFHAHHGSIDVATVPERAPSVLDPRGREVHLSVGAALFNLRLALGAEGLAGVVRLAPPSHEPRVVATVRVAGPTSLSFAERELFDAIPKRRTSRLPFSGEQVPYEQFDRLQEAASIEGAHLEVTTGLHRSVVVGATHDADATQRHDAALVSEVARWTVDRPEGVGIPTESLGPMARDPKAVVRDFALGQPVEGRPTAEFEETALLCVLLTSGDAPADWMRGGMALQRVLLTATVRGLSIGLLSQATEVPDLRWLVRDPASAWRHPQLVLRVGYGDRPPVSPRLPLSDVLEIS